MLVKVDQLIVCKETKPPVPISAQGTCWLGRTRVCQAVGTVSSERQEGGLLDVITEMCPQADQHRWL